ncbi:hypothetical protein PLICRDRAFT_644115 [Plicaturopsis crispa FD-325 SS-3]|nr:hypothetical protein PLICRDRAFT_644115 [Plicaturopsis crispa FD-325 SS-3]
MHHNLSSTDMLIDDQSPRSLSSAVLSIDDWIHVMSYIAPQDLIALRKCSRALREITQIRIVWINALHQVTSQPGAAVFGLTFPVKEMTLSQLEHAATAPRRLISRIQTHGTAKPMKPMSTRTIRVPQANDISNFVTFTHSQIVPGGRFLVTQSTTDLLALWDLGFGAKDHPYHIASIKLGGVGVDDFEPSTYPTDDGKGLLVATVSDIGENRFWEVYEIYPWATAKFVSLGKLLDRYPRQRCVLSQNMLIYGADDDVVVWDFRCDTWVRWRSSWQSHIGEFFILAGPDIIVSDSAQISVWRIPPLQPRRHTTDDTGFVDRVRLLFRVPWASGWHHSPYRSPWSGVLQSPYRCRSLFSTSPTPSSQVAQVDLLRYTIHDINQGGGLPSCIPVLDDPVPVSLGDVGDLGSLASFQSSDDEVIFLAETPDDEEILTATVVTSRSAEQRDPLVSTAGFLIPTPIRTHTHDAMFCPMSGRFCACTEEGDAIYVLDFLMPPPDALSTESR